MVEFMSGYTPAMDRVEQPIKPTEDITFDIEKPIIPIGEIGTTFIDQGGNILQNLENQIRMGTKKVQLVLSGGGQGISTFSSSWGKDVRRSMYEKAKATGVTITGIEMSPQMMQGLSGMDREGRISEAQRQRDVNQVRDAIRFAADIARGGGIDIYSQEFQRSIYDAEWNTKDKIGGKENKWKDQFFSISQEELKRDDPEAVKKLNIIKYLIDKRSGDPIRGSQIKIGDSITQIKMQTAEDFQTINNVRIIGQKDRNGNTIKAGDFVDYEGNVVDPFNKNDLGKLVPFIDPLKHDFKTVELDWKTIQENTKKWNDKNNESLTPEEYLYKQRLLTERTRAEGQALYYSRNLDQEQQKVYDLVQQRNVVENLEKNMTDEARRKYIQDTLIPALRAEGISRTEEERLIKMKPSQVIQDRIQRAENSLRAFQEQATSARLSVAEVDQIAQNITTPYKYAREKTFQSYAEAGIDALNVTKERKLEKPIYVGPEIGMASEMYGGHPDEFIELIKESRKKMADELVKKQGYDEAAAKEAAKNHIKGMMDTSHMMMWYKHFKRKDGESDEKHIKRFNEWLIDQTKKMVKEGVVGGVQVVDTITGEHAHLPAGQGAFDVVGMVKAMKEEGFKGDIISEGHSEDTMGLGQGRILTETWRAFGSPVGNYMPGQRAGLRSWGGIQHSYFGYTAPPTVVLGGYAPGNDWRLWSETPLE